MSVSELSVWLEPFAELSVNYVKQIYRKKSCMTTVDSIMRHCQSVNGINADQQFKPSGSIMAFTAAAANISRIKMRFLGQSS